MATQPSKAKHVLTQATAGMNPADTVLNEVNCKRQMFQTVHGEVPEGVGLMQTEQTGG